MKAMSTQTQSPRQVQRSWRSDGDRRSASTTERRFTEICGLIVASVFDL